MSTQTPMEVKKDGLRQTQDGLWKLTVTVHPNDMETSLLEAPMGTRYMMAMVQIGDDEKPVEPKKRLRDEPRSRQFQKMCGVEEFQDFARDRYRHIRISGRSTAYEYTNALVKEALNIGSSGCLDSTDYGPKWDALLTEYEQATNKMAEER